MKARHVTVYKEKGRYAGWPANYGLWWWDDEIMAVFTVGYYDEEVGFHKRDRSRPFVVTLARSLNGGESWNVEEFPCFRPETSGFS